MLRYMLDTNLCIFTIKNKPTHVREAFNLHHGRLCISTVTLSELIYGAENSQAPARNLSEIEGMAARLEVLMFDSSAASHSGQIRSELKKKGTPIGPYDVLIAGHARSLGLTLITNNTREFTRVDGLRTEDWAVDH
ncbi:tRNA(fMet)-specific endonuclease VapC [Alcaligenaceae bacterium]|nr:tRNA(fMet)-specific endonuclease VapC [Alcaligenaceae bacterium]